jgi:DNA-binding NarL/FixJ family response regulator
VLLADDHGPMLDHTMSLLQPQFEVVGMVNDGRALVNEAQRLQPDVIVMDITMPVLNGIAAARELRVSGSPAKLVFLTVHQESAFVRRCLAEGALGYVTKSRMITDLIPAIKEALSNRRFISPPLQG